MPRFKWRNNGLFNKWCWKKLISTFKWIKLDLFLTPYMKLTQNRFIDMNVRTEAIKLFIKGRKSSWPWVRQWFFRYTTRNKTKNQKRKLDKLDLIDIFKKPLCCKWHHQESEKTIPENGGKYLQIRYLIKDYHWESTGWLDKKDRQECELDWSSHPLLVRILNRKDALV